MSQKEYNFTLRNIDIEHINKKYGITEPEKNLVIPDSKNITYLDQSKHAHLCIPNSVDLNNKTYLNCYWDTFPIGKEIKPVGCPILFVPPIGIKEYTSSVSKNKYIIRTALTALTKKRVEDIENKNNSYYVTDKAFCSYNCTLSYIEHNKHNALYKDSKMLLYKMYRETYNQESEIVPAGERDLLAAYGGELTIEKYRENFNNVEYINQGILQMIPLTKIFEENYKL